MGVGDGTVQGAAKILNNGPDNLRLNVVLVAEGFQDSELPDFETACNDFVAHITAEPWFGVLGGAINVHRLNVASNESGADDPADCDDGSTGSGASPATYFDASFCNSGIRRCLSGDDALVSEALDTHIPEWHVAAVLVNTTQHGGCALGDVSWTAMSGSWKDTVIHELGHAAFGLADEYNYWAGCSLDDDRDEAPLFEPGQRNITANTDRATLKWRDLLTPGAPVPTMLNPDCTECDDRPNVLLDDAAVGLYEGAGYYHCGRFRPSYVCKMRSSAQDFCRVCVEAIAATLAEFIDPVYSLEVTPDSLDFGSVPFGMTMYRSFTVRNPRSGFPGAMDVSLTGPVSPFGLAPATPLSFTLPAPVFEPGTERQVFVAFTAPETGGPGFGGSIDVASDDDPAGSPVPVNLLATAIPPPPVDSVLVIDRSGSMSDPASVAGETKTEYAISAASLYVSLLKPEDRIGLVRFATGSGPSDVLLTMRLAGAEESGAGRLAAWGQLTPANLAASGVTSIGAGIINGSNVLDAGSADARAIVVLTDGLQNTAPDVPAATATVTSKTPEQRVFAVGLGLNQLEDKLHQIASVTDGVAQITGDLVDDKEFLLRKLYVQILADVSDEAFVRDPSATLYPGQKRATNIFIGEVDVAADFILTFRESPVFPKYLRTWLEAPNGTVIRPTDEGPGVNMAFHQHPGSVYFRVHFPVLPGQAGTHAGRWRLWVENISRRVTSTHATSIADQAGAILIYAAMAKARSDLRLDGRVIQPAYEPGSPMTVVLEPTLYGLPVALDPPVRVRVLRPDLVEREMTLLADPHGAYQGIFDDTGLIGPYLFSTEVSATTPLGTRVTRHRTMTGIIYREGAGGGQDGSGQGGGGGQDGDGGGWDDAECREARALLERLRVLLERCCKRSCGQHPGNDYTDLVAEIARHESALKALVGRDAPRSGDT